jgi:peptide/nickel transport system permease protein
VTALAQWPRSIGSTAAILRDSPRLRLVARRVLIAIPVLIGVSLATFLILDLLPGNTAQQLLGANAPPEQVQKVVEQLGLDRPAHERYLNWMAALARGELGNSIVSGQPVAPMLAERLPVTLELVACAFAFSLCFAVPLALLAARWPGGVADRLTMLFSMGGLSIPSYVLALLVVLVFSVGLGWFPSIGFTPFSQNAWKALRSLTLPAIALALPIACFYVRFLASDLLEQMRSQDYVTTAIAKGVSRWGVLVQHALRNSLLGLLTVVGLNVGALIGGTVVVEQIFALPGIGHLLLQSINVRDVPIVQALVLFMAAVTVLANMTVDLLYTMLDPRIRYGQQ